MLRGNEARLKRVYPHLQHQNASHLHQVQGPFRTRRQHNRRGHQQRPLQLDSPGLLQLHSLLQWDTFK